MPEQQPQLQGPGPTASVVMAHRLAVGPTPLNWGLAALLAALPYETTQGLRLIGLTFTSVEIVALATLGLWGLTLLAERRWPSVPGWLLWPLGLFVGAQLLSAMLAPAHQVEALKQALRQAQGGLLALLIAERVSTAGAALLRLLLPALAMGAAASAALGLLELSAAPQILELLSPFKLQLSLMEGVLRLSGTFGYANTAAMYFEAVLPLALATSLALLPGPRRLGGVALVGLLVAAVIGTYSRAGLLVCAVLLALTVVLVRWRWGTARVSRQALALALGAVALGALCLLASPVARLRLGVPNLAAWYDAGYAAASPESLTSGERRRVQVTLTNMGRATWDPGGLRPIMLSYHWLEAGGGAMIVYDGLRTPLPRRLAPGETVTLQAQVQAPQQPGRYLLAWGMVREHGGGWFAEQMPAIAVSVQVTVGGAAAAHAAPAPVQVVAAQPLSPGRSLVWPLALALWSERPWLGIGPDGFRHVYGQRLGIVRADPRIHTNNLYLEVLTGSGLAGLAALGLLLLAVLGRSLGLLAPTVRAGAAAAEGWRWWCLLASSLGLVAFLAHGVLDVFLAFTATCILFYLWIGVSAGLVAGVQIATTPGPPSGGGPGRRYADQCKSPTM